MSTYVPETRLSVCDVSDRLWLLRLDCAASGIDSRRSEKDLRPNLENEKRQES